MRGMLTAVAVALIVLCVGATARAHWGYVVAVPAAPVVAYYPPVAPAYVAAYPAPYVAAYAPAPYVAAYAPAPYVAAYAPAPYVAAYAAPVYVGRPVAIGPAGKVYPYGQPVRNAARFVLPPW